MMRRDGGSTHLFPKSYDESCAMQLFLQVILRLWLSLLMRGDGACYTQMKSSVARSASTICEHLKHLRSADITSTKRTEYGVWVYE